VTIDETFRHSFVMTGTRHFSEKDRMAQLVQTESLTI